MKLYVAARSYDYEGFDILGIYDKKSNAQARSDLDTEAKNGDSHDILHYELNKDEEM